MTPGKKQAFEPTGLIPRSIVRTFERFYKQLLPKTKYSAIREYRISRYQVLVSIRCLCTLLILPLVTRVITNWLIFSYALPQIKYFWDVTYQDEHVFSEIDQFSQVLFFDSLLDTAPSHVIYPSPYSSGCVPLSHVPNANDLQSKLSSFASCSYTEDKGVALETINESSSSKGIAKSEGILPSFFCSPVPIPLARTPFAFGDHPVPLCTCTPVTPLPLCTRTPVTPFAIGDHPEGVKGYGVRARGDRLWRKGYGVRAIAEGERGKGVTGVQVYMGTAKAIHPVALDYVSLSPVSKAKKIQDKITPSLLRKPDAFLLFASGDPKAIQRKSNIRLPLCTCTSVTPLPLYPEGVIAYGEKGTGYGVRAQNLGKDNHSLPQRDIEIKRYRSIEDAQLSVSNQKQFEGDSCFKNAQDLQSCGNKTRYVEDRINRKEIRNTQDQALQNKIFELAESSHFHALQSVTNVFADLASILVLIFLLITLKPEITILKSFLVEVIYNLSDTTKSFLLILMTDLLVGFHSPRGWETMFSLILHHFGLPENQDFVFLFVATLPVILDTVFKYWIFRHLNKISPSTVATYHNMIE